MREIEHNPHEKRLTNGVWWALAIMLIVLWGGYFYFNAPDWWGVLLGLGSGSMLATWAIEKTGNKVPDIWR